MVGRKKTHEEFVKELRKVNPYIEVIGTYKCANEKIKCKCLKCGHIWSSVANQLLRGSICPECNRISRRISNEEFMERFMSIGETNIELLGEYVDCYTKIPCRCKIHDYKWEMLPGNILKNKKCPLCTKNIVVHGYNDLLTMRPDLEIYIVDKNEVYDLGVGANKKIKVKCPLCGYTTTIAIHQLTSIGFSCQKCSDGISYPNKFSRALLEQLPIENIDYEWSPDWIKPYRYDNYFEYNGIKYILEMDGKFHYKDNGMSNMTVEEQKAIDDMKDEMAVKHNIKMIRIDCQKSDMDYIKTNIINSELNTILDLSNIDWVYCNERALHSVVYDICDFYNNSENKSTEYIGKHFHMSRQSIIRYLKQGHIIGICDYTVELAEQQRIEKSMLVHKRKIKVFDQDSKYIGDYDSITNCSKQLQNIYGIKFDTSSISKVCRGKYKSYKGFTFQYVS